MDPNLPINNTRRYFLDYIVGNVQHTLCVRTGNDVPESEASTNIGGFLTQLAPILRQITIAGFRRAEAGSNVTNSVTWSGATTYGTGNQPVEDVPKYISFIGRDAFGERVRVFVFGVNLAPDANWRISATENTAVANAITYLRGRTTTFLSIRYMVPVWKSYANFGYHAYWQRQRRTGG